MREFRRDSLALLGRKGRLVGLGIVVALAPALACIGSDPYNPGTSLGTFGVTAHVASNQCMAVVDPWSFSVKLSENPGELYWIQNDVPVDGPLQANGSVVMTSTSTLTVDATADGGKDGCIMQRVDTLSGTASGTPITGLTGSLSYVYSVVSGGCADQLASAGGPYQTLPCTVSYTVAATRTAAPADTITTK